MTTEMKQLTRKRGAIKCDLSNFITFLQPIESALKTANSIDEKLIVDLQLRFENLELLFQEFKENQMNIEYLCEDGQLEEQYEERKKLTTLFSDKLATAKVILNKLVPINQIITGNEEHSVHSNESVMHNSQDNLNSQLRNIKLPIINLPKFNGNYNNWLEFKDTFLSLIHVNETINNVQKYHYLRASLEGEASKVIQSLEFSAENYIIAWELICNRYNNSRLLVHNHIKSLYFLDNLSKESSTGLRNLIDSVFKHIRALSTLKQPTQHWDALIVFLIATKLDRTTAREWEKYKIATEFPTLNDMKDFLGQRAEFLETIEVNHNVTKFTKERDGRNHVRHVSMFTTNPKCNNCQGQHLIYNCGDFLKLDVASRAEKAKSLQLCINCLRTGHNVSTCRLKTCIKCNRKHNSLLHIDTIDTNESKTQVMFSNQNINSTQVLLSTVLVHVTDAHGNHVPCRALLDSGAQSNFLSESLLSKLSLQSIKTNVSIVGINGVTSKINKRCNITILSMHSKFKASISCFVLPKISDKVPSHTFNISSWNIPPNINLADPDFNVPNEIDLLIGASLFWDLLTDGRIRLGKNSPGLQNTHLGWVISGTIPIPTLKSHCNLAKTISIEDEQLKKFWELEECTNVPLFSTDENICETHFQTHTSRDCDGRFVVRLPLKESTNLLGNSEDNARKRFLSLERRLQSNVRLQYQYKQFMEEYQALGHMTKVGSPNYCPTFYLPHHGVLKESSVTTKLRVVFNGSFPSSSGWSINDLQYVGPKVQNDIFTILLRFRQHTFVVSADIAKMYRQILIHTHDRPLQRIFWREDPNDQLSVFELNTVTYGTTAAPYLAIRCLKQLALENQSQYESATQVILNDFYVDDLLTGCDRIQDLSTLCKEVSFILKTGCFELRKWISNNSKVLEGVTDSTVPNGILLLGENESSKTLGIQWVSNPDILTYRVNDIKHSNSITKRAILSAISQIYDPLGLLSPCIILTKILIQKLWTLQLSWDDCIPSDLGEQWEEFKVQLGEVNKLQIPRHALCKNSVKIQLHGFCDASQNAYAACIYVRSTDSANNTVTHLLCAKTRVAPLKSISIPRLELCGALMLSKLMKRVADSLTIDANCFYWCDSQVVLWWLKTQPSMLQVFVGNRVSEIQSLTRVEDWYYVNTLYNPSDPASRGIMPRNLCNLSIWWHGPSWLSLPENEWPILPILSCETRLPELRKELNVFTVTTQDSNPIFYRFSNLHKLKIVVAYCFRFFTNCKIKNGNRQTGILTAQDLEFALLRLIMLAQEECYKIEIGILKTNAVLPPKHKLSSLTPFIDEKGFLRVGGRLQLSNYNKDIKHPLVLSSKHNLTKLIFSFEHIRLMHAGPQLLLASIRQRYWPISGRNLAKQTVRNCLTCYRFKPNPINPIMGMLPEHRVMPLSPFQITGVDYAGPFLIKDRKGRGCKTSKCYLCLFVCFSTKALHLELATDMTTEAFIASLRRFIARRGRPIHIYSDNGSTFVGAQRELQILSEFIRANNVKIVEHAATENITWHFIPPYSPNFGGLWEAGVKSVKYHIKRILGNAILTYEEFCTLLSQIEATLNSRPLYPLSSDPNDLEPLTPSHFLIGRAITSLPDPDLQEVKVSKLSRYQMLQQMHQHFWSRWAKEYLAEYQQRNKWNQGAATLEVGTLVIIKEDNLPPNKWLIGRITILHPGKDNISRVATIRTSKGTMKRPIRKLCVLPRQVFNNESSDTSVGEGVLT